MAAARVIATTRAGHRAKGTEEFADEVPMDLVVTVCDDAAEECPLLPAGPTPRALGASRSESCHRLRGRASGCHRGRAWCLGARGLQPKKEDGARYRPTHAPRRQPLFLAFVASLFGFTAIALGLVGYVTALFKLSSVLTFIPVWWCIPREPRRYGCPRSAPGDEACRAHLAERQWPSGRLLVWKYLGE